MNEHDDYLAHYGTPRHSGRYPWGSGKNPQRSKHWRQRESDAMKNGDDIKARAEANGLTVREYKALRTMMKNDQWNRDSQTAMTLRAKGMSMLAISERMGVPVSTVESYLDPARQDRFKKLNSTADALKRAVEEKGYIDVSAGVEHQLGVSKNKLEDTVNILKMEGYTVQNVLVPQLGTNKQTTMKVLAAPGTTNQDVWKNRYNTRMVDETSEDGGLTFEKRPIKNIDSKRIQIRYAEEGGTDRDGVIELRRGAEGLDLGKSRYAQVRIAVDGTHYLKGMAIYADDLPDGIDIRFNSNKHIGTPKLDTMKAQEADPDNPFKAALKPGPEGRRGYLNIVREEGDWSEWSSTLASQFLSKQEVKLAKKQLDKSLKEKQDEFDDIMNLTNPVVRRNFLESFSDDCDSAAVHLKAASMPRQTTNVILPLPSLKKNEIYAPNYNDGEEVILVRYPHGGPFEIPRLIVNNKNKDGKRLFNNARDAVGIHPAAAAQLSGADFDGDTALVIPTKGFKLKTEEYFKGLRNFDAKESFPYQAGMESMGKKGGRKEHKEMGMITNLITDMQLQGASEEELTRAVRHSMVVIDAAKHKLNFRLSEEVNGIRQLKEKYQNGKGASTLISRAKGQYEAHYRKENYKTDPETGQKIWTELPDTYTKVDKKTGKIKKGKRTTTSTQMYETEDAFTLSSGTKMENTYASYANSLKSLGNLARKEAYWTQTPKMNKEAKIKYSNEVKSLSEKLKKAESNAPLERRAHTIGNFILKGMIEANPDLKENKDEYKKAKNQCLQRGRELTGAHKQRIVFTEKEVEAINAGAISSESLKKLLRNSDQDKLKEAFTPRVKTVMTPAKIATARSKLSTGRYTMAEVADFLGVSVSTLSKNI